MKFNKSGSVVHITQYLLAEVACPHAWEPEPMTLSFDESCGFPAMKGVSYLWEQCNKCGVRRSSRAKKGADNA